MSALVKHPHVLGQSWLKYTKPEVPSKKINHSQDDIDAVELDKLFEEIHSLHKNPDVKVASNHRLKKAGENCYNVTNSQNGMQAGKFPFKSDNSKFAPYDDSFIQPLAALGELNSKTNESKRLNVKESISLDQLINQNKKVQSLSEHLSLHPTTDKNNCVHSNPSHRPSLIELVNKTVSKAQVPNSLLAPGKIGTKPSSVPEEVPNNIVGPVVATSLADLAKQYKSQRVKVGSPTESSVAAPLKVNEDMSVLLSLVVQVPGLRNSSDCPCSLVNLSENENPHQLNQNKPLIVSSKSSTGFLDDLTKTHTLTGNDSSTISLSNLAQQHKHSAQPLLPFSPQNRQFSDPMLISLFKNVTIKDTKHMQHDTNNVDTDISLTLSNQRSSKTVPDLSLASCLKSSKKSNPESRELLKPLLSSDTEDCSVVDIPSNVDSVPQLPVQEKTAHTNLISPPASSLGFVLCFFKWKGTLESAVLQHNRPLRYPKFKCSAQVGNKEMYVESVYHKIEPFDFSTPSPDDIVKNKQKQAFTRPDKEFEL